MTITIQKWGNSHGIRLPKHLLDEVNWNENEEVELKIENKKIIIEKVSKIKKKNIEELFADYDGTYEAVEISWGEPVGEEIW